MQIFIEKDSQYIGNRLPIDVFLRNIILTL